MLRDDVVPVGEGLSTLQTLTFLRPKTVDPTKPTNDNWARPLTVRAGLVRAFEERRMSTSHPDFVRLFRENQIRSDMAGLADLPADEDVLRDCAKKGWLFLHVDRCKNIRSVP